MIGYANTCRPNGLKLNSGMPANLADYGLVGNCQIAALVHRGGAIAWACFPRFDSEPVFAEMLDPDGGAFVVAPEHGGLGVQHYIPNTNVLVTTFDGADGAFRVVDFAPRFTLYDRMFRPTKLIRILEVIRGTPRVRVRCQPVLGWSKVRPRREYGSNHITFSGFEAELRLTTNIPLAYVDGPCFALTETRCAVLAWGAPVEEALAPLCERFLWATKAYWEGWVKHCNVPAHYQAEVIRSALVLKLHCYEDTGAIVAALTTSIPEAPHSGRTWDYRYCWLRDAFFALKAFQKLGHFEEREAFLHYLQSVVARAPERLAPLYRIDGTSDLAEQMLPNWAGFDGHGPVRIGNGAAAHLQHDIYGELILALSPLFLDARFSSQVTPQLTHLVKWLAQKAHRVAGQPDAGIWELRTEWRPQTFSAMMCWAALDRAAEIARRHFPSEAEDFLQQAAAVRTLIETHGMSPDGTHLVSEFGGREVDAALLLAVPIRFLPARDATMLALTKAIQRDLQWHGWLRRYRTDDGFGQPQVAFVICTAWLLEVLARQGETDAATQLLAQMLAVRSPLGLLAEDVDPTTGVLWGNFPQAYSHVGLIVGAFLLAPDWDDVL